MTSLVNPAGFSFNPLSVSLHLFKGSVSLYDLGQDESLPSPKEEMEAPKVAHSLI